MLDHIGSNVSHFERSWGFYEQALVPLGITLVMEGEGWAMAGKTEKLRTGFAPL